MLEKMSKIIRMITVSPVMATIMLFVVNFSLPGSFKNITHFIVILLCLVVFPVLAYPVSFMIPKIKAMGRNGQRGLAIAFSIVGYVFGGIFAIATSAPSLEIVIYVTYFITALILGALTLFAHKKVSGHTCGVTGPVAMLSILVSPYFLFGLILVGLVYYSSMALKRHTFLQLFIGSLTPVVTMLALFLAFKII